MSAERLPLVRAAWVIARRDFVAILFSRAFIFFLLGPLFPITIGALAGNIGQRVESAAALSTRWPTPPASTIMPRGSNGPSRKRMKARLNRIATKSRRATI